MKNLKILFLLILVSCETAKVKNSEWCGDLGPYGATCFKIISEEKRELDKLSWDEERFGMICGKAEAFANLKEVIQKLCYKNKKCEYEKIEQATKFLQGIANEFNHYKNSEISAQVGH